MKQMTSGMIAFCGVLALAGCYSYTSETINNGNYNTVQATPNFAVVRAGDSDQMIVRLVNDANNGAITSYTVSNIGAGILVHYQANFRPVFDASKDSLVKTGDKSAQQYYIVGVTPGTWSFDVTPMSVNTAIKTTVKVVVTPRNLGAALSKSPTANVGDTVTLTAPAGTVFSQSSAISFPTGPAVVIAFRSPDSTSIQFTVGSGVTGVATVTKVGVAAVPSVSPVTLVTTTALATPATPTTAAPTISSLAPTLGQNVTVTLGGGLRFHANSKMLVGTLAATIVSMTPDSGTAVFSPNSGSNGLVTFTNVSLSAFPSFSFGVTTTQTLQVQAPTVAPATLSAATALIGVPFTVTLGGGMRFLSNSHVLVGGAETGIQSVSGDNLTATVMPLAGSTGAVTFTNIALVALPAISLNLPSDGKTFAVGAAFGGVTDPLAAVFATAPTIALRPTGSVVVTGGTIPSTNASQCGGGTGDGCAVYKVVLTGTTTYDIVMVWQGGSDLGLYRFTVAGGGAVSGGAGFTGNCDNGGQGGSGQPETCTAISLPAGTYYFGVEFFGTGSGYSASANTVPPTWFQFLVTVH